MSAPKLGVTTPEKWVVYHGAHVAFYYDGPTAGDAAFRTNFPFANKVRYPNGTTPRAGDTLRCAHCGMLPVVRETLRWEEATPDRVPDDKWPEPAPVEY